MIKRIVVLSSMITVTLFLTGCISSYDIQPQYNKKTNILKIDNMTFNNVTQIKNDNPFDTKYMGVFKKTFKKYIVKDQICSLIDYYSASTDKGNAYLTGDAEDWYREMAHKQNKNVFCDITKISNLKFMKCYLYNKYIYAIESTQISGAGMGYGSVQEILFHQNKQCFDNFLHHFVAKANKDKIKI